MAGLNTSSQGTFFVEKYPVFQMNDGANPGTSAILGRLPIWLPDPDTGHATPSLVTLAGNWSVNIHEVVNGTINAVAVDSRTGIPGTVNFVWIALDPAIYDKSKIYRVQILDAGSNVVDEWDFALSQPNFSDGSAGVAAINNAIRRIAGLLGYRQQVTYSDYILGIPTTTTILLRDATGTTLATYRRKLTLNSAHTVTAVTSAAADSNVL